MDYYKASPGDQKSSLELSVPPFPERHATSILTCPVRSRLLSLYVGGQPLFQVHWTTEKTLQLSLN
jgi:hypothetical protein